MQNYKINNLNGDFKSNNILKSNDLDYTFNRSKDQLKGNDKKVIKKLNFVHTFLT